MKIKSIIKILLIVSFNIVFYYIGEYHGREGVESKPLLKTDTLYIQKERICERDCYTGAVECQEFAQPVRGGE